MLVYTSEPLMNMPTWPAANAWLMSLQPQPKSEPIELSVQRIVFSMFSA